MCGPVNLSRALVPVERNHSQERQDVLIAVFLKIQVLRRSYAVPAVCTDVLVGCSALVFRVK
jgi:hypothetical protein